MSLGVLPMGDALPAWQLLGQKCIDDLRFTAMLLRSRELPLALRLRLTIGKYVAIAMNKRSLTYLGGQFHYDNRLTPALLPGYLVELQRLNTLLDLSTCQTVVDVGANVGQFAATLAWRYPHLRVWSFEPNPEPRRYLERNAAQTSGWSVVPWGISDEDRELDLFFVPGKSSQGSTIVAHASAGLLKTDVARVQVPLRRLSTARRLRLEIPAEVDVLKVDVEGSEAEALNGLVDLRWRFLLLETSQQREGLGLDEALVLLEQQIGRRPEVVWADDVPATARTRDVILRRM